MAKESTKGLQAIKLFGLFGSNHQAGSVYDIEGLCPTLDTMQGGYRMPLLLVKDERVLHNNDSTRMG